jgi:hypothetical protein
VVAGLTGEARTLKRAGAEKVRKQVTKRFAFLAGRAISEPELFWRSNAEKGFACKGAVAQSRMPQAPGCSQQLHAWCFVAGNSTGCTCANAEQKAARKSQTRRFMDKGEVSRRAMGAMVIPKRCPLQPAWVHNSL